MGRTVTPGTARRDLPALRRSFQADGFCVAPPVLPAALLDDAVAGVDAVVGGDYETGLPPRLRQWSPGDDPEGLIKVAEPHVANRAIYSLVTHPALGRLAADIVDAEMLQVWAVDLFVKLPSRADRANVGWHQDAAYAPYWEGDVFTVWVPLSGVSGDSAPLRYVPGSHRLPLLPGGDLFEVDLEGMRHRLDLPAGFVWDEVRAAVPRGGFALHHRRTLHASGPNLAREPRRALAVRLRTERCRLVHADARPAVVEHLDDPTRAPVLYPPPGGRRSKGSARGG